MSGTAPMRVIFDEAGGRPALEGDARFDTFQALLERGYAVTVADGAMVSPAAGRTAVLGLFNGDKPQVESADPDVTVSIKEYRPFYLHGEVENPGGFPYQPKLTVQKAIALGGGFTERASKKKITVIRGSDADPIAHRIKLHDPVHAGDVITVHQGFF